MPPILVSGARCLVYINGRKYGVVTGFDYESNTSVRAIETIDDILPAELAPTRCKIKGSVKCYRIAGTGGLEGMGITAQFNDIPLQKYFSITLIDKLTDNLLFSADYCMCEGQRWSFNPKGLNEGSFNFQGISWNNESVTSAFPDSRGLP